ncbi:MAG TPA: ROK family protein [Blastocatellia bacterium]|nr:ROK family protein [Blastocatellia bacterium]
MNSYVLGMDLGGTKVMAAAFDSEGNILSRARAKTLAWRDSEEVFETIARTGQNALERAGVSPDQLVALGIGSPGPLDPETGTIIESANLNMDNFPLGLRLAERFGCPVVVENDVNAGVYGEFRAGAARGANDVVGLFIGTGIGGGIIINGSLYHGYSKNAGEIGHIIIKANGPRCGCGNRGCLEALASRVAMTRDIRKAIKHGTKTALSKLPNGKGELINSRALKRAFDKGDKVAAKVVNNAARYIGISIGSLVNLLSPEVVVLGGGVIEAFGRKMMGPIEEAAREVGFEFLMRDVRIVRAELGDDAGMVGAALLARERIE